MSTKAKKIVVIVGIVIGISAFVHPVAALALVLAPVVAGD